MSEYITKTYGPGDIAALPPTIGMTSRAPTIGSEDVGHPIKQAFPFHQQYIPGATQVEAAGMQYPMGQDADTTQTISGADLKKALLQQQAALAVQAPATALTAAISQPISKPQYSALKEALQQCQLELAAAQTQPAVVAPPVVLPARPTVAQARALARKRARAAAKARARARRARARARGRVRPVRRRRRPVRRPVRRGVRGMRGFGFGTDANGATVANNGNGNGNGATPAWMLPVGIGLVLGGLYVMYTKNQDSGSIFANMGDEMSCNGCGSMHKNA